MDTFEYQPIDLRSSAFRLVRLLGGAEVIECELIHTTLDENVIPYEAVSYTWGASAKPSSIKLEGRNFMVTSNLWSLLHDLRQPDIDRYLWIDAISINQADHNERGHQIRRMQVIYSGADRVLFYLGETTTNISTFMDSLAVFQSHASGYRWEPDDSRWRAIWETTQFELQIRYGNDVSIIQKQGLQELLERPWFRRVWILQEVANARKASLYCGRVSILVPIFALSPGLLQVSLNSHLEAVFELMPTLTYSRTIPRKAGHGGLLPILVAFRRSEATDPRDKIFALLGLCTDQNIWEIISPDYTQDESALVRAAIRYIITKGLSSSPKWILSVRVPSISEFLEDLALDVENLKLPVFMERILIHILSFWDAAEVRSFLVRKEAKFCATQNLVLAAVSNRSHASEVLSVLLEHARVLFYDSFLTNWTFPDRIQTAGNIRVYSGIDKLLLRQLHYILWMTKQPHDMLTNQPYDISAQRDGLYRLLPYASVNYLQGLALPLEDRGMQLLLRVVSLKSDEREIEQLRMDEQEIDHLENDIIRYDLQRSILPNSRKTGGFEWWAFFTMTVLRRKPNLSKNEFSHKLTGCDTRDDNVALYFAIRHGHLLAARCLLEKGAVIVLGRLPNPLCYALHNKDYEMVKLLRVYGANIVGYDGRIPLHCAAELEPIPVIRFLLDQGADPGAMDEEGQTALQVARHTGRAGVVRLLEAAQDGRLNEFNDDAAEITEIRTGIDEIAANVTRMHTSGAYKHNLIEKIAVAENDLEMSHLPLRQVADPIRWWLNQIGSEDPIRFKPTL
ncbi:heterokaryon incompatibility protein-domain-containing protein [Xylaria telfairii]|nr:heterokaryon incompatibility protein-domain-containing protein [Xylaria telfairii]